MSDVMIKVEGLGKKYIISHEARTYTTLRDIIAGKAKNILKNNSIPPSKEEFWALKDVSFEVKQGEAIGIIGRNGAGKSTLLKVLSRITEPTYGRIEINGRIASLLEVGTGFHPELTGKENIFLNGAILGMSRAETKKKFEEIVDFSGVEKFLDTPVKRYSSGMYVRLAFAVAAHMEPEILIVDEVLAVGDAEFQKKCLGKMNDVSQKEGRTVLFVSHNMEAVQNLCTHGLLIQQGTIIHSGEITDTVKSYVTKFLKQQTEKEWTGTSARGNKFARLRKAKVKNLKTGSLHEFDTDGGFQLELEIENLATTRQQLDITYHLIDERGILVTVSSTGSFMPGKIYEPGKMKIKCSFPGNVLNQGVYTLSRLLLVKNSGELLTEWNDVLTFEILPVSTGNMGWQGHKEGVVKINNASWEIIVENDN